MTQANSVSQLSDVPPNDWVFQALQSLVERYGCCIYGITFIGAALALSLGWELQTIAIYAYFAGIAAIVVDFHIINLAMTKQPILSGTVKRKLRFQTLINSSVN